MLTVFVCLLEPDALFPFGSCTNVFDSEGLSAKRPIAKAVLYAVTATVSLARPSGIISSFLSLRADRSVEVISCAHVA